MLTESVDFFSFSDDDDEVSKPDFFTSLFPKILFLLLSWNKWVCGVRKRHNTRENWSWRKKGWKDNEGYFCPNWVILRLK
ncbi:hypothetical protein AAG906_000009 [Vitis piasezkii]